MVTDNIETLIALNADLNAAVAAARNEIADLPEHLDPSNELRAIMIASARANAIAEAILEFPNEREHAREIKARAAAWLDG